jgi:hypothetical protein
MKELKRKKRPMKGNWRNTSRDKRSRKYKLRGIKRSNN